MAEETNKRKPLSKKMRFDVFKRDGFVCQYCGATPPNVVLHVDHITPVVSGGKNNIDNLITSCEACNLGKGASHLSDIPKSLADRAEEISEREAQIKGYNKILEGKAKRIEKEAWDVVAILHGVERAETFNSLDFMSIKRFLDRLPAFRVKEAAESAFVRIRRNDKARFKYFCGVCWGMIRESKDA